MELRQIKYFLTLAEELHFSEAAFKLGISQPSLSQQIKNLEVEIGFPLFDRIGKKNHLTQAGQLLKEYGLKVTQTLDNLADELTDLREENTGEIRVAMLPSDLDYRVSEMVATFHKKYPEIKIKIEASIEIEQKLLRNEVDFGLGIRQSMDEKLIQTDVFTETYDLFVSKELANDLPDVITPEEVAKLPLIMFPEGYYGRELMKNWGEEQNIVLEPIMEISSAMTQFQLVEKNVGVTIQPQQLKGELMRQSIQGIEIKHPPTREVVISHLKDKYLTQRMLEFMKDLSYLF